MSENIKTAKLSVLIESLQDILKKEGDVNVVMSSDEEGNGFNTFDPVGDINYCNEGGIVVLYPTVERLDLDEIDGYEYNENDDEDEFDYDRDYENSLYGDYDSDD